MNTEISFFSNQGIVYVSRQDPVGNSDDMKQVLGTRDFKYITPNNYYNNPDS